MNPLEQNNFDLELENQALKKKIATVTQELQELKERGKKLFIEYDKLLKNARARQKMPVATYYSGNISTLFKIFGRTNENRNLVPEWILLQQQNRERKEVGE